MSARRTKLCTILGVVGLTTMHLLTGCSTSTTAALATPAARTAPAVVTVSDAPLGSILSAKVTISALSVSTGAAATPVSVLTQPVTVELSGLGGVQEPVELTSLAFGTYTSATVTVSAAQVTYLNASGQVVTASANIATPTVTVALTPALAVSTTGEVHVQFGFDLTKSFDLTGTTLTFTPAISTSAAAVGSENGTDRQLNITGTVISITPTAITVQSGDSGRQFTLTINSTTVFPTGVATTTLATGSLVIVQGQTQTDGTLLATSITPTTAVSTVSNQGDGAQGIITSLAGPAGQPTGLTLASRESFGSASNPNTLNVVLTSATAYVLGQDAVAIGLASSQFTNAQMFAGQSVFLAGTVDSTGTLTATTVTLSAESVGAALAAAPQGASPNLTFTLTLPVGSYLTTYDGLTAINVVASAGTTYGHNLTAATFAALAPGTQIEVSGFLLKDSSGAYTLYAGSIGQIQAPEAAQ